MNTITEQFGSISVVRPIKKNIGDYHLVAATSQPRSASVLWAIAAMAAASIIDYSKVFMVNIAFVDAS